eukprot:10417925-Alexandrium_andersonii.AAC.1
MAALSCTYASKGKYKRARFASERICFRSSGCVMWWALRGMSVLVRNLGTRTGLSENPLGA